MEASSLNKSGNIPKYNSPSNSSSKSNSTENSGSLSISDIEDTESTSSSAAFADHCVLAGFNITNPTVYNPQRLASWFYDKKQTLIDGDYIGNIYSGNAQACFDKLVKKYEKYLTQRTIEAAEVSGNTNPNPNPISKDPKETIDTLKDQIKNGLITVNLNLKNIGILALFTSSVHMLLHNAYEIQAYCNTQTVTRCFWDGQETIALTAVLLSMYFVAHITFLLIGAFALSRLGSYFFQFKPTV